MQAFMAMIVPMSGSEPPLGIWGGRPPNYVDIGGPGPQPPQGGGQPPGYWGGGNVPMPTPPIHLPPGGGGQPPGYWGGGNVPMPTPPIYFPPAGSQPPLGIWGGAPPPYVDIGGPAPQPKPEHPIVLPPNLPPTTPEGGKIEWKTGWTPQTGWVVVGVPQEPHPTPSSKK
jgi:hypothetical protein